MVFKRGSQSMLGMIRMLFMLGLLAVLVGTHDAAEPEGGKGWQAKVKGFSKGLHPEIRPITLTYQMSWNGAIESGRTTLVLDKPHKNNKKLYLMQAYGRSTGVAGALFPFSFV